MPWKCIKCGYETTEFEGEECSDCGGALKEADSEIDWLAEKEDKDLSNPEKYKNENKDDDVAL